MRNRLTPVLFLCICAAAHCQGVPRTINYQGVLSDSGGTPIDATVAMEFKITDFALEQQPVVDEGHILVGEGIPIPLAHNDLVPASETVTNLPGTTTYTLGVDYNLDYVDGTIERTTSSSIPDPGAIFIDYTYNTGLQVLWSETRSVTVNQGVFDVALGAVSPIDASVFSSPNRYLEVRVEGEMLGPRRPLLSVAYALKAESVADGAIDTDQLAAGAVTSNEIEGGTILGTDIQPDALGETEIQDVYVLNAGDTMTGTLDVSADTGYGVVGAGPSGGGSFSDVDGSGWARLGYGDRGVDAQGSGMGGYFQDSDDTGVAEIASGNIGVDGAGSAAGGYFHDTDGAGEAYVGSGDYGIQAAGAPFGVYTDNDIYVGGKLGIGILTPAEALTVNGAFLRAGSEAFGVYSNTHVNLGSASVTGAIGSYEGCTVGGGASHTASGSFSTVSGGDTNEASGTYDTVGGGLDNIASGGNSTVGGGSENQTTGGAATVAGGAQNTASEFYAFVGGGEDNDALGMHSTVCGGNYNSASGQWSAIGGGRHNMTTLTSGTVCGGQYNTAAGSGSAIVGGANHNADGIQSFIGGGQGNSTGAYAVVPGGEYNVAGGDYSFAGGKNMQLSADSEHSFVWGYSETAVAIDKKDAFIVYSGDVGIGTIDPGAKLDVDGDANVSGQMTMAVANVTDLIQLTPLSTAPSSPSKGAVYMDDSTNKLMVYDGTAWQACW